VISPIAGDVRHSLSFGMKKLAVVTSAVAVLVLAGCGANVEEKLDNAYPTAECPQADAADLTAITQERADMLIGFTESNAEACATSLGWAFRVGERDGESFAVTADYSQQRITVSVTNDLVTAVAVG
jgi:outer membrane biogenesis lipoprotein LolB